MNKSFQSLLVLLLIFSAFYPVSAQEEVSVQGLSLEDAIRTGLENSFQLQIAQNNLEIAQNENTPGFAGAHPTVDASVNLNNTYTQLNQPASFLQKLSNANSGISPGVSASWLLYGGGRIRLNKTQLEELEARSEGNVRIAIENTVESIILSYYAVLLRQENLRVLTDVLRLSRDRIEFEQVKQEFGQASTFDILQTRDAYLNDSTTYLAEVTNFENSIHNLNRSMNIPDLNRRYVLTDSLIFETPLYELATLRSQMLANNNQLNNLYIDRELAQVNTRLWESDKLPQVVLNTGATYNINRNLFGTGTFANGDERDLGGIQNRSLNGFLNFGATYNIYQGGARDINIQNARIREINAQLSIQDAEQQLLTQLENTYAAYLNEREQVRVTAALVENAQRNLEIAAERFRGGLINSFDFRIIQVNFISATQARLQAIFALKLTETELRRLTGGLVSID